MPLKDKLEKDIQREICQWLEKRNIFFWRSNNIPVFSRSNDGKMRFRAMPKYSRKGIPDILCVIRGICVGIEVKRPGAVLRPEQIAIRKDFDLNGGKYYVVTDVSELSGIEFFPLPPRSLARECRY